MLRPGWGHFVSARTRFFVLLGGANLHRPHGGQFDRLVHPDELQIILELEQELWLRIGIKDKMDSIAEMIKAQFNSPKGYYISALYYYNESFKSADSSEKEKLLKTGYRKCEKALNIFPHDENCLQLRCKIYSNFSDFTISKYYDLLYSWYLNDEIENVSMLFEFGRVTFMLEYYDLSKAVFEKLQSGIGMGNNLRARPRNPIMFDGVNKKFFGEITDIYNRLEGFIKPSSLTTKYKIPFRPVAAKYSANRGDFVSFEIAFSFRGPVALNVMKK